MKKKKCTWSTPSSWEKASSSASLEVVEWASSCVALEKATDNCGCEIYHGVENENILGNVTENTEGNGHDGVIFDHIAYYELKIQRTESRKSMQLQVIIQQRIMKICPPLLAGTFDEFILYYTWFKLLLCARQIHSWSGEHFGSSNSSYHLLVIWKSVLMYQKTNTTDWSTKTISKIESKILHSQKQKQQLNVQAQNPNWHSFHV